MAIKLRQGEMKYIRDTKQRRCTLRNYNSNKYNWLQVIGHVHSKHPAENIDDDDDSAEILTSKEKP